MSTLQGFTREQLLALFGYDAETGTVTSKVNRGSRVRVGDAIGRRNGNGYLRFSLQGKPIYVHRLAYFLHHGCAPAEVDHKDLNRTNNAIANLRAADRPANSANGPRRGHNASGFKGVHQQAKTGRWRAQIKVGYRSIHLGYFDRREDAHAAYVAAAQHHFGGFARAA